MTERDPEPRPSVLRLEEVFVLLGLLFVLVSWYALTLAEVGLFSWPAVLIGLVLLTVALLRSAKALKSSGEISTKTDWVAVSVIIAFSALSVLFFHDTFYGGRDPGTIANAAAYLSQHGGLTLDRFVNYPGWVPVGNSFVVQFLPGYVSWVALFFLVDRTAVSFSNLIPLILGLASIYFVARRVSGRVTGVLTVLLIGTSYPMFWFSRGTFNEIYFMALVWFGILLLLVGWQERKNAYFAIAILSFGLAAHTRIEGMAILAVSVLFMLAISLRRPNRMQTVGGIAALTTLVAANFVLYVLVLQPTYLQEQYAGLFRFLGGGIPLGPGLSGSTASSALRYHFAEFVISALSAYRLFWPILFIPLIALLGVASPKLVRTRRQIWVVLAVASPTLIFLAVPFVTLDQPWFLKRYVAIILPLAFLSMTIFIWKLFKSPRQAALVISLVILTNVLTAGPIILHQEYLGTIDSVAELSSLFTEDDVVLVDRFAAGNYKLADPLFLQFGRYALWVSSPSEVAILIDKMVANGSLGSGGVYLLIGKWNVELLQQTPYPIQLVFEGSLTYKELERTVDLFQYPGRPPDVHDLDFSFVESLIRVPELVIDRLFTIQVYMLDLSPLRE